MIPVQGIGKVVLAINRVFSLVGHDNKHYFLKGPKCLSNPRIMEVIKFPLNNKIRFKAFHIFKAAKIATSTDTPHFYIIILGTVLLKL